MSVGGAFPRRQLAPREEIDIMLVNNAGTVHVQEVHAKAVHLDEEVSEDLVESLEEPEEDQSMQGSNVPPSPVPLAVVPPPAIPPQDVPPPVVQEKTLDPSRVGWKKRTCFRNVGDDYYHHQLLEQLRRIYPKSQMKTYYRCTKRVHPRVGSEWEIELSVTFFDPIVGGQKIDATFTSVVRHESLGYALADVAQQAYLEYKGRDPDPLYVNDSFVLRAQVGTLLVELKEKNKTLKRVYTQRDDLTEKLGKPRIF